MYSKDLVDFVLQYDKVLLLKIEDKEIQVKHCNEKQCDNIVSLLIETHQVVDVQSSLLTNDNDDLYRVYIEQRMRLIVDQQVRKTMAEK